jgi:hypothetical protein
MTPQGARTPTWRGVKDAANACRLAVTSNAFARSEVGDAKRQLIAQNLLCHLI